MRLLHYSAEPIAFNPSRKYEKGVGCGKPPGFWVSVEGDGDWRSWCEGEQWGLDRMRHAHEVTLRPSANILRLSSEHDLYRFTERHGGNSVYRGDEHIRWPEVMEAHQGIIIAPYQWKLRLHHDMLWYYGWDCASGCIWDLDAIESVTLLEPACTENC